MSQAPNLTLISEFQRITPRDFYLADPTLLNPNNANPIVDGEWLEIDGNYKAARGTGNGTSNNPSWQVFAEKGRYDTQAIGKTTLLFLGAYEAETTLADLTSLAVGKQLVISTVTIGGLAKRALQLLPIASGTYFSSARVTRVNSSTGKVRFVVPAAGLVFPVVVP